jgi:hypothetical protein
VTRNLGDGQRTRTRAFTELISHFLFRDRVGRSGKGNDKGKVEGLVKYTQRTFMTPLPHAASFEALNAALAEQAPRAQAGVSARVRGRSPANVGCLLEKTGLILAVEGELKPNTASGIGNWLERDWLDFAVIQPKADNVHCLAEGTFRLFFDAHDEWRTERHIALLPFAREAGARGLSVGAASRRGEHQ